MDIEKLKLFYQVAQQESLTAAAKQLSIDKSSLSRKIAALEESLSIPLFDRRHKKLSLTNKGELLFQRVQRLFSELKNIEMELQNPDQVAGNFRIATTHAVSSTWLSKFLYKFIELYPKLHLNITASNEDLITALSYNDVAIRPYAHNATNIEQEFLMRWRLQLFGSNIYFKRFGMPKHPDDLYNHRIILFADSAKLYTKSHTHWILHMHTKFGRPRTPFMTVNSLQAMYELVRTGVGLGAFAKDSPLMREEQLFPVLEKLIYTDIDVYYIYPTSMKDDYIVQAFATFLKDEVKSQINKQVVL